MNIDDALLTSEIMPPGFYYIRVDGLLEGQYVELISEQTELLVFQGVVPKGGVVEVSHYPLSNESITLALTPNPEQGSPIKLSIHPYTLVNSEVVRDEKAHVSTIDYSRLRGGIST